MSRGALPIKRLELVARRKVAVTKRPPMADGSKIIFGSPRSNMSAVAEAVAIGRFRGSFLAALMLACDHYCPGIEKGERENV